MTDDASISIIDGTWTRSGPSMTSTEAYIDNGKICLFVEGCGEGAGAYMGSAEARSLAQFILARCDEIDGTAT